MSEEQITLSSIINKLFTAWNDKVGDKTVEDLGGTEVALVLIINEITLNIYPILNALAVQYENLVMIYNADLEISNANFGAFDKALDAIAENMTTQNEALNKALNTSIKQLNSQMTNRNKVLDKQLIKLSKSVSKITGGNS